MEASVGDAESWPMVLPGWNIVVEAELPWSDAASHPVAVLMKEVELPLITTVTVASEYGAPAGTEPVVQESTVGVLVIELLVLVLTVAEVVETPVPMNGEELVLENGPGGSVVVLRLEVDTAVPRNGEELVLVNGPVGSVLLSPTVDVDTAVPKAAEELVLVNGPTGSELLALRVEVDTAVPRNGEEPVSVDVLTASVVLALNIEDVGAAVLKEGAEFVLVDALTDSVVLSLSIDDVDTAVPRKGAELELVDALTGSVVLALIVEDVDSAVLEKEEELVLVYMPNGLVVFAKGAVSVRFIVSPAYCLSTGFLYLRANVCAPSASSAITYEGAIATEGAIRKTNV